ncbi:MAG: TylF/MycF family methyltransferase [Bacteroidota bacterium]|nr:TylF/MycF family methyltransferase [Bacteroidota bacterium]
MLKKLSKKILLKIGYSINKTQNELLKNGIPVDITEPEFLEIYEKCKPYTFTSIEPMYALYKAVCYISKNNLPGDTVECGVWKGGSAMLIALTLLKLNDTTRKIYLYDTFDGMSEPTEKDVDFKGISADQQLKQSDKFAEKTVWCVSGIEEVKRNLISTGYPEEKLIFIKGKVEESIPGKIPEHISLLRLDTDWYESTYHEFIHLYPLLIKSGVLIIDDYGHWKGARDATDTYFKENNIHLLLNRIDYTVRMGIKS